MLSDWFRHTLTMYNAHHKHECSGDGAEAEFKQQPRSSDNGRHQGVWICPLKRIVERRRQGHALWSGLWPCRWCSCKSPRISPRWWLWSLLSMWTGLTCAFGFNRPCVADVCNIGAVNRTSNWYHKSERDCLPPLKKSCTVYMIVFTEHVCVKQLWYLVVWSGW